MSNTSELFKDPDYCFSEIGEARKIFGDTETTKKQYDAMEKALGLMYLYCPEDIRDIVYATMQEATFRRTFFILSWVKKVA